MTETEKHTSDVSIGHFQTGFTKEETHPERATPFNISGVISRGNKRRARKRITSVVFSLALLPGHHEILLRHTPAAMRFGLTSDPRQCSNCLEDKTWEVMI